MATSKSIQPKPQYTAAQFNIALETIASRICTLNELLIFAGASETDSSVPTHVFLNASQIIATSIGALADDMLGGEVHGTHDLWNFGPNFADAGKAVQHG